MACPNTNGETLVFSVMLFEDRAFRIVRWGPHDVINTPLTRDTSELTLPLLLTESGGHMTTW